MILKNPTLCILLTLGILFPTCRSNLNKKMLDSMDIAQRVAAKGEELVFPGSYQGILYIHAMAEIGAYMGEGDYLKHIRRICADFGNGSIEAKGNFICYESGGTGAAYLVYKGLAPELESQVLEAAERMMIEQPRSSEGLMIRPGEIIDNDPIFIDVAFAVTPYMLYMGLAFDRKDYVDYAVFETLERIRILKDLQTGLVHQARGGFQGKSSITEDNWSRGNGWAALALAALIRDLPKDHPKKEEVGMVALDFFKAVLEYQNEEGLWHQEMTDPNSFVETSGSGLLLYALGVAIETKLLDDSHLGFVKKGLENFLAYVTEDGSISHTSSGLLAVGNGKKEDYIKHPWTFNESHAFGAASLAYIQAVKLGMETLEVSFQPGAVVMEGSP